MKWLTATLICFSIFLESAFGTSIAATKAYIENHALLKAIEGSTLVVVGEVVATQFVSRSITFDDSVKDVTTDVIVDVQTVLKGKPNAGKSTVKFMIEGGKGLNPETGKMTHTGVVGTPEFSVGEQVLLFLTNDSNPFFMYYPHDGYRLFHNAYGKVEIEKGNVELLYYTGDYEFDTRPREDGLENRTFFDIRVVVLPLDLVVKFSKALAKDKNAAIKIENAIKSVAKKTKREDKVVISPKGLKTLEQAIDRVLTKVGKF